MMKPGETHPKAMHQFWVNFITTEPCSPEPWNHGLFEGHHPLLWPQDSGEREICFFLPREVGSYLVTQSVAIELTMALANLNVGASTRGFSRLVVPQHIWP